VLGLDRYGVSAPGKTAFENLGFTVDHVVELAKELL
jgi:transketolase